MEMISALASQSTQSTTQDIVVAAAVIVMATGLARGKVPLIFWLLLFIAVAAYAGATGQFP
jgi:hypothetical protein